MKWQALGAGLIVAAGLSMACGDEVNNGPTDPVGGSGAQNGGSGGIGGDGGTASGGGGSGAAGRLGPMPEHNTPSEELAGAVGHAVGDQYTLTFSFGRAFHQRTAEGSDHTLDAASPVHAVTNP